MELNDQDVNTPATDEDLLSQEPLEPLASEIDFSQLDPEIEGEEPLFPAEPEPEIPDIFEEMPSQGAGGLYVVLSAAMLLVTIGGLAFIGYNASRPSQPDASPPPFGEDPRSVPAPPPPNRLPPQASSGQVTVPPGSVPNVTTAPPPPLNAVEAPQGENGSAAPTAPTGSQQVPPASGSTAQRSPSAPTSPTQARTTPPTTAQGTNPSATETGDSAGIQAGQFVQPALGNQAEVELISVERIQNPQSGDRDLVSVQMRVRRVAGQITDNSTLNLTQTTAQNPASNETYTATSEGTAEPVLLENLNSGESREVSVKLQVPPNVDSIDIIVPSTGMFQKVPIPN